MRLPEFTIEGGGVWCNPAGLYETPLRFVLLYEIEYQRRTCGETIINGAAYPVAADTVIFARPGDIRRSRFTDPAGVETAFFRFSTEEQGALASLLALLPHSAAADETAAALWETAQAGYARRTDGAGGWQLHAAVLSLLLWLCAKGGKKPAAPPAPVQRALFAATQYMNAHLGETVTVEELAAHIGYSRTQFSYLFKVYTGHTPHAYFRSLKLTAAKRMLLETDRGLSEIAATLGFSKVSKFGGAFKKEYGVSPGKFRKCGEINSYEE